MASDLRPDQLPVAFADALTAACHGLGLSLTEEQLGAMQEHYRLMLQANRRMNLTRITSPEQAAVKHYADSLALLAWAPPGVVAEARVLDVGTGAGFPALPLAICRPTWRVLAVDSTRKKADFVASVAAALALGNLSVQAVRARELSGRVEPFGLVTSRAVSDPLACLRETRRLVTPGGWVVCYTTPSVHDGLSGSEVARAERMGFQPPQRHDYVLTVQDDRIDRVLSAWRRC